MSTETLSRYERLPTDGTASMVEIPQYGMQVMLAVWAAAALPMALLAGLVAPALADRLTGDGNVPMVKALLLCLTGGPDLAVRAARRTALARAAHVFAGRRLAKPSGFALQAARGAAAAAESCG